LRQRFTAAPRFDRWELNPENAYRSVTKTKTKTGGSHVTTGVVRSSTLRLPPVFTAAQSFPFL